MATEQTTDFTDQEIGVEVDYQFLGAPGTGGATFAINGRIAACPRCGRPGLKTEGTGGVRFYIHSLTAQGGVPPDKWPADACQLTPITGAQLTGGSS